jgi:hypothetical protein
MQNEWPFVYRAVAANWLAQKLLPLGRRRADDCSFRFLNHLQQLGKKLHNL